MAIDRRKFLRTATTGASALALSSFPRFALADAPSVKVQQGFQLLILATKWGNNDSWEAFFTKCKEAGYNGTEIWYPNDEKDRSELFAAAAKHKMQLGFLCSDGAKDPKKNFEAFTAALQKAVSAKPLYINCHTAKDFFSADELKPFFEHTIALAKQTGIPIYHETHRGRALYSAPLTRGFIRQHPGLRLTLDVSHWCNVHESLLQDQAETMEEILPKVEHIHARIGHAEGPQVSDPRAPEWKATFDAHIKWWDAVVERKKKAGERLTILTEFGPPDYMPTVPYTRQPLADQWAINVHMLQLLRKRYS